MFETILKGGVGSGRHKGIPMSKLYKLVHRESGKIIAEGTSKHITSMKKAKNKEHGDGTHFVGIGSPKSTLGGYWSNSHTPEGVKKEETMSILDTVNERFNAQKESRELQLLSPLERIAKAIQDDVMISNPCLVHKDWKDWNDKHKHLAQGHESALKYHDRGSFEFKGQSAGDLHKNAANLHRTALAAHQKALIEPSEENPKKAMCATGDSKDATYAAIKSTPAYQPKGFVKKEDLELIYKDWTAWNDAKRGMTPTGEHTGAHLRPASNPKPGMAFRFAATPNKHSYGGESTRLDNHQFDHKTYNKNPNPSAHHAPNAPQVAIDATKERAESHIDEANKNRHSYPGEKELVHSKPQAPKKQGRFAHFMDSLARMGSSG